MTTKTNGKTKPTTPPKTSRRKRKPKPSEPLLIHQHMHSMDHGEINRAAVNMLTRLLDRCTLNLVSSMTGVTRPTLYRWLNPNLPIESMNVRDAAWFVLVCETSPRVKLLMDRPPSKQPRLAKRLLDSELPEGE